MEINLFLLFQLVGAGSEMYGDLADVVDENGPLMGSDDPGMRRRASSSASTSLVDPNQVLGTLHCTMKYSFDKNALIVTVNRCENLPAKDSAAKSRYVSGLEYQSRKKILVTLQTFKY